MRLYGFRLDEILSQEQPDLDQQLDPKTAWALRHPERFPVDINRASYEELLRVPGIGFKSARRIVASRRLSALRFEDLPVLGVVMKRARFFVECAGRTPLEALKLPPASIRQILLANRSSRRTDANQLEFAF